MIEIKKNDDLITKRIKATINLRGFENQKKFCESFDPNLNESLLSDIFNGKRRTIDNLLLISDKLDCSLDFLVGKSDVLVTDPIYQMIGEELHLSQASLDSIRLIHLASELDKRKNPLEYLLSFPDSARTWSLLINIMKYLEAIGEFDSYMNLYDPEGQATLLTINTILREMKENSDKYLSAIQEAIQTIQKNSLRTDIQDSLLKLYTYKLSSIREERNYEILYKKEKLLNKDGKE